jgi:hypothetical protein
MPGGSKEEQKAAAAAAFRPWAYAPERAAYRERVRRELRGKDLVCWCKPGKPCHADVLLEIANGPGG